MVTISIDGPGPLHDELRGLPGSWDRAIETLRRLREIRQPNFQTVAGMTLVPKNVDAVDATHHGDSHRDSDFTRAVLHFNVALRPPTTSTTPATGATCTRDRVMQAVGGPSA